MDKKAGISDVVKGILAFPYNLPRYIMEAILKTKQTSPYSIGNRLIRGFSPDLPSYRPWTSKLFEGIKEDVIKKYKDQLGMLQRGNIDPKKLDEIIGKLTTEEIINRYAPILGYATSGTLYSGLLANAIVKYLRRRKLDEFNKMQQLLSEKYEKDEAKEEIGIKTGASTKKADLKIAESRAESDKGLINNIIKSIKLYGGMFRDTYTKPVTPPSPKSYINAFKDTYASPVERSVETIKDQLETIKNRLTNTDKESKDTLLVSLFGEPPGMITMPLITVGPLLLTYFLYKNYRERMAKEHYRNAFNLLRKSRESLAKTLKGEADEGEEVSPETKKLLTDTMNKLSSCGMIKNSAISPLLYGVWGTIAVLAMLAHGTSAYGKMRQDIANMYGGEAPAHILSSLKDKLYEREMEDPLDPEDKTEKYIEKITKS